MALCRLGPLFALLVLAAHGWTAEAPTRRPASPLYGTADLAELVDALTFHISFDAESLLPDLAAGERHQPTLHRAPGPGGASPQPEFAEGVSGRALVLGTAAALFPSAGNIPFQRCGAIALWVKPLEWQRPNGANTVFLMTGDCLFYLQRQGPMQDAEGRITRHEGIQYLAKSSRQDRLFTGLGDGVWENGRWYFLVANWSWPQMQLSVDGRPFSVQAMPERPTEDAYSTFLVGATGGDRGLLDELMAFGRPLSLEEIGALHRAYQPQAVSTP